MNVLGKRIEYLLAGKNLKQIELAEKMNVTKSVISDWVNGRSQPNAEKLLKLSEILEISIDMLVGSSFSEPTEHPMLVNDSEGQYQSIKQGQKEILHLRTLNEQLKKHNEDQADLIRCLKEKLQMPEKMPKKAEKSLQNKNSNR